MANNTDKKTLFIGDLDEHRISAEINDFLESGRSRYFDYDPRMPIENAILKVFRSISRNVYRDRVQSAVRHSLHQAITPLSNVERVLSLLNLVEFMGVMQADDLLVKLADTKQFPSISVDESRTIKERVLSILAKSDIPSDKLETIISHNITDPDYTEVCLAGALRLRYGIDSFVRHMPTALKVYRANADLVKLDMAFRMFLRKLGPDQWSWRGADLLYTHPEELGTVAELLAQASTELRFSQFTRRGEPVIEATIEWPYGQQPMYVSTAVPESMLSDQQLDTLEHYQRLRSVSAIRGASKKILERFKGYPGVVGFPLRPKLDRTRIRNLVKELLIRLKPHEKKRLAVRVSFRWV